MRFITCPALWLCLMSQIQTLVFDKNEQPRRAVITTSLGPVKVQWRMVCGERCWFASGTPDAKRLAVTAIQRIERLASVL